MVLNLRRTGATVLEVDPETGRQFRVQAHGGHFGGSLDGLAINLLEAPKAWHVLEFKTHSNKSFGDLVAKKVRESKPQHFAQMQIYMHLTGITRAFYVAVCKDTDALHIERIEADVVVSTGDDGVHGSLGVSPTRPFRLARLRERVGGQHQGDGDEKETLGVAA